jgi:hypothetical protein
MNLKSTDWYQEYLCELVADKTASAANFTKQQIFIKSRKAEIVRSRVLFVAVSIQFNIDKSHIQKYLLKKMKIDKTIFYHYEEEHKNRVKYDLEYKKLFDKIIDSMSDISDFFDH